MNCKTSRELFSDHFEGTLDSESTSSMLEHLESCSACHAQFESFRYATEDLKSLQLRETSREHVDLVMAAVDRAAHEDAAGPRWIAPVASTRSIGPRRMITHVAAALLGAAAIILFWPNAWLVLGQMEESAPTERIVTVEGPERIEYVDRIVEVEVPVEVPVEIEVPVEKIVEVEKLVEVERLVDRPVENPLQPDLDALARQFGILADTLNLACRALDAHRPPRIPLAVESGRGEEPSVSERPNDVLAQARPRELRSPVSVVRGEGGVQLSTFGTTADIVPALIALLEDPDPSVVAVAEQQLQAIRSGLDGIEVAALVLPNQETDDPSDLDRIKKFLRGGEDEAQPRPGPAMKWQSWWSSNRSVVAALDQRGTF